ncbi:Uncharacterized protein FKW44_017171 [Caligus rogercresseyi]|uniref:Uncharacterized protein n=1 Tax=Caligus rogercresseyi TaxID=217165 RepID=A0A7T8H364_CALRO|nr:Uncharacterized protein FKW44_014902 [Caligus rogercresseyi]QQP41898.1 Uncharacterized protein FKW44_016398 [Caligus rogercresseyi]QQP42487.1 Uncharacterized protein FKW44_017171 [Caligus rogercresseyi]
MKEIGEDFEKKCREEGSISCILFDGRIDMTNVIMEAEGSEQSYMGKIKEEHYSVANLDINPNFNCICVGPPLIKLPDEVIQDLSTDQHYGYKIVCAVREGVLPAKLALLEIGPVNHSRWLTTANRFLRLWVSKHGLRGKNLKNLQLIVEFIIGVYYPCWFNAKVKHCWIKGPRHILFQLDCLKSQKKEVLDLVMPTVRRSAWYAHSEMLIQALLCSEDQKDRINGVEKILTIRGEGDPNSQLGDSSVRMRKTPEINTEATSINDLISWSDGVLEPPLTCSLSTLEVKGFINSPMKVPNWPCHTQSIERVVKMVTEASAKYYSQEKRDGAIRAQEASRRLMAKNDSKQDLFNLIKYRK